MIINQNKNFKQHNTSKRAGAIKYIVIHYVGATGGAEANVKYYNQPTTTHASADFFVGHNGEIWQYNPNLKARYCWSVGGANNGGKLYSKVKNNNSISVEMCVKTRGSKVVNSPDWYFTQETIASTIELVKHLMDEFDIPSENVVRHYDVTGKVCPGVVGWNPKSKSEHAWNSFKAAITEDELTIACKKLYKAGIIDSPDYWAKGSGYSDKTVQLLIKKFAAYVK